jgi:hypothetical protein
MQRLAVAPRRLHYKPTFGENRGRRRSCLGGNQGSHFYAWWAPKNAPPLRDGDGFAQAPEGAIFLRDIRHHDNHSRLSPQLFTENYLPVTVAELRGEEYGPPPWTLTQSRFAQAWPIERPKPTNAKNKMAQVIAFRPAAPVMEMAMAAQIAGRGCQKAVPFQFVLTIKICECSIVYRRHSGGSIYCRRPECWMR